MLEERKAAHSSDNERLTKDWNEELNLIHPSVSNRANRKVQMNVDRKDSSV